MSNGAGFMMMEPPLGESPMFNVKNQKMMNQYQHPYANDLYNFNSGSINSFSTAHQSNNLITSADGSFQLPHQHLGITKVQPKQFDSQPDDNQMMQD
jgi:hypothetical protein